jgi:3'-phosphoadenosine 5'-phosphosulfate sulfotransferase (PAPS reductase)/FAD synthetase
MNKKEILDLAKDNLTIFDSFAKAYDVIPNYKNVAVSISGGADSDILIDMFSKCDFDTKIHYIWFDTGLEYQATKDHLKELESKYNIKIDPYKAEKPIPLAVREYGQPFISKYHSAMIERLQRYNFKFEDKPFDELLKEYPNCKSALMWWCNKRGENSSFSIGRTKLLKEFMIENPPTFKISDKCCLWAKKKVAHKYEKENNIDLKIVGLRKAEGGIRSARFTSCFDYKKNDADYFRPIFWFKNEDKKEYEKLFNVEHSKCYTEYGLDRTGCAGCPFGKDFEKELEIIQKYEPKLYVAVNNIFKDSYEYTRKFIEFKKK